MDIYVTLSTLKKILKEYPGRNWLIFESKRRVVAVSDNLPITLHALKPDPHKEFRRSFPILGVGYASIAATKEKPVTHEEIKEYITELMYIMDDNELADIADKARRILNSRNRGD